MSLSVISSTGATTLSRPVSPGIGATRGRAAIAGATFRAARRRAAVVIVGVACACAAHPTPAAAFNPLKPVCAVAGLLSGVLGKACAIVQDGGRIVNAGRKLLGGHVGSAVKALLGQAGRAVSSRATAALGLAAIGVWVLGGAKFALHETAKVLSETTTPHLGTSWFSATYWRVAGIAALLTLPFLFAAAVQAMVHSDLPLLLRAVLGHLPIAMLAVAIAAPLTMLLLSASDELSSLVSSASGQAGARALALGGGAAAGYFALSGSPFLIFFLGLLTVAGAMALWVELLMREAAVYVVVLMLPLAFAALVWPARRVWATRAVELLVALILSKFVIVAVLSLGGAAMDQIGHSITSPILGLVIVMMGAFAPWALLRLIPLAEVASAAVGSVRGDVRVPAARAETSYALGLGGDEWASRATADMRRAAGDAVPRAPQEPTSPSFADGREAETGGLPEDEPGASGPEPPPPGPVPEEPLISPAGSSSEAENARPEDAGPRSASGVDTQSTLGARIPGLPEMWQAEDLTWRPLPLGLEEGWPPRVWPPDEHPIDAGAEDIDDSAVLPAPQDSPLSSSGELEPPLGDPLPPSGDPSPPAHPPSAAEPSPPIALPPPPPAEPSEPA